MSVEKSGTLRHRQLEKRKFAFMAVGAFILLVSIYIQFFLTDHLNNFVTVLLFLFFGLYLLICQMVYERVVQSILLDSIDLEDYRQYIERRILNERGSYYRYFNHFSKANIEFLEGNFELAYNELEKICYSPNSSKAGALLELRGLSLLAVVSSFL